MQRVAPNPSRLSADQPSTRLATRLSFLAAGFGMACWAPLVPYAKARLGIDDGVLGLLLLCLGVVLAGVLLLTSGVRAGALLFLACPLMMVAMMVMMMRGNTPRPAAARDIPSQPDLLPAPPAESTTTRH